MESSAPVLSNWSRRDILYFERSDDNGSVRVVINLSDEAVNFQPEGLEDYRSTFSWKNLDSTEWGPWSFEVFVKANA